MSPKDRIIRGVYRIPVCDQIISSETLCAWGLTAAGLVLPEGGHGGTTPIGFVLQFCLVLDNAGLAVLVSVAFGGHWPERAAWREPAVEADASAPTMLKRRGVDPRPCRSRARLATLPQ